MSGKTASDFDPELLSLFDSYVHGIIDRRGFLDRAKKFAVGGVTAAALLDLLNPKFAEAEQVAKSDPRLKTEYVEVKSPSGSGKVRAYLAHPAKGAKKVPGILVVHENRGLNPHIEDIARRIALEGFIALAPDALTPLGGYPGDEDKGRELFAKLDQTKTHEDFVASLKWLEARKDVSGKVGVVGFCYGGGIANLLATRVPELGAAVPFYGSPAPLADVPKIKSPLMLHFAETDERINAAWPEYKAVLEKNKIAFTAHVYPGTQHGFNNDTTPRYDAEAAKLAWSRTMDFFRKHLRG